MDRLGGAGRLSEGKLLKEHLTSYPGDLNVLVSLSLVYFLFICYLRRVVPSGIANGTMKLLEDGDPVIQPTSHWVIPSPMIPPLFSWGPQRFNLFVIGTDGGTYHKAYANGWTSSTWTDLGGIAISSVAVATLC